MGVSFDRAVQSFKLSLAAENKSPNTISGYLTSVELFRRWLVANDRLVPLGDVTADDVNGFIAESVATRSAATASTRYKGLRIFFQWASRREDLIARSPMDDIKPPAIPETPVPVLTDVELKRLLKVCEGKEFDARRDTAIILMFCDTGARRAELAGLKVSDVDLAQREAVVLGKGRRPRIVKFGAKTAKAIDRYLYAREQHQLASSPMLWLGRSQPLEAQGIRQMLERRGTQANVTDLHAHRFRHTFAHLHLASGGHEGDLMQLAGWKSRQMLTRYASSVAAERARAAYESPMDRL